MLRSNFGKSATKLVPMDGNTAAAHVAYRLADNAFIYPITPSSPMGEHAEEWSAKKVPNIFGYPTMIKTMQSEGGAAGALHGSAVVGSLSTTFTASQGLLLMIPNIYKIAGELLPVVFHVASRALSREALSIYGDHDDVMAIRQTGIALLSSGTVQEVMDLAAIAHMSAIKSRIPFCHFFDGFRLSHEYNTILPLDTDVLRELVDLDAIDRYRATAMNPEHPMIYGHSQGPDSLFQNEELANSFYFACPDIVQEQMDKFAQVVGRQYHLYEYYGAEDADKIIVIMGSGGPIVRQTAELLNRTQGTKYGVVIVRLYRPFDTKRFVDTIPKTVKKIAVLDRTKESGAVGEPLFVDVCAAIQQSGRKIKIVGGRYGKGSKEFDPSMVKSVYDNLSLRKPKNNFTVGIVDDVTFLSLPPNREVIDVFDDTTKQCIFYGLGGDGTVGANKDAIKIIVENTDNYGQGYFSYSADKSNSETRSYLRFGPKPISQSYLVKSADYIASHKHIFVKKFDMLDEMKEGGIFVLNSSWDTIEKLEKHLPTKFRRELAQKKVKFYNIDASKIAESVGLGNKINLIMQTAFFLLNGIIKDKDKAISIVKKYALKTYGRLSDDIVEANLKAIDIAADSLVPVEIPPEWAYLKDEEPKVDPNTPLFVRDILYPMKKLKGSELPVSSFPVGGVMPLSTSQYVKNGIADKIPIWNSNDCIQCNMCSFACPHSAIRPFVVDSESPQKPDTFETIPSEDFENAEFRIQVSPMDCTGCTHCAQVCPMGCLEMKPYDDYVDVEQENWEYASKNLKYRGKPTERKVKKLGYTQPLLEFPPSCPGCGETQAAKVITQMFGHRMTIANSSGCSSVWGGRFPVSPYRTNPKGYGPAWGRSLFEDTAEYGYGMALGMLQRRKTLRRKTHKFLGSELATAILSKELHAALANWHINMNDAKLSEEFGEKIKELIIRDGLTKNHPNEYIRELVKNQDMLVKKSHWIIGGDGFAYDIGYGGLDYVISQNVDVNILVLDTEVYSNTGGQMSRATMPGAVAKFAYGGKVGMKKDLGMMAISYGTCYVASIILSHPKYYQLAVDIIREAEAYPGPSLIIVYSNCLAHGLKGGMAGGIEQAKEIVDTGYWPLYKYNPELKKENKNPFILYSKKPRKDKIIPNLIKQQRFRKLVKTDKVTADKLFQSAVNGILERYDRYKYLADKGYPGDVKTKKKNKKKENKD